MQILFFFCLGVILWVYFGYPLVLALGILGRRRAERRISPRANDIPMVSLVVAAHNEESNIEGKLKNLFASDYPRDRLEILVGSDGSSDRTEDIVRRFDANAVGLISFPKQQGKSAMQNRLVAAASGSILIFTDADSRLAPDALRLLVEDFDDPRVGLVTAHPRYSDTGHSDVGENESLYFRYEGWLRREESDRGLLALASGPLFGLRRALWQPLDQNLGDDFILPLRTAEAGLRNVLDPRVHVWMPLAQNRADALFAMKIRIVSKDLRGLLGHRQLLNPVRCGWVAIGLWSHKLLRWLIPYFLVGLVASNAWLIGNRFFAAALLAQAAFYALAALGLALRGRTISFPLSIPFSFCLVNAAALVGTLKCLAGKKSGQWKPIRKHSPAPD